MRVMLAGLLVLAWPSAARASVDDVAVPGTAAWTDTGITVYGGLLTIVASGTIKIAYSDPGKGPTGDSACVAREGWVAPGLACWSLIGRIGDGAPFAVGSAATYATGQVGRLYLGVDDEVAAFGDNSGAWSARVLANTDGPGFVCLGGEQCNGQPHPRRPAAP